MAKPAPTEEPTFIEERWYVRFISKKIAEHTGENETQLIEKHLVAHRLAVDTGGSRDYLADIVGEAVTIGIVLGIREDWHKLV